MNFRNFVLQVGSFLGLPEAQLIQLRTPRVRVTGPVINGRTTLAYAAAMPINAALGNLFVVSPTDNVAFAFGVPTNAPGAGLTQRLTIKILNASGGALGAATFTAGAGGFRIGAAWVQPANGFSRTIDFQWDQVAAVWAEVSRSAADVAN